MLRPSYAARAVDALTLETARAGLALACAFSSSAEFDAALIAERRAAGIYGPKRRSRRLAMAAVASALALLIALIV